MSSRRQRPTPPPLPSRAQWLALMHAEAVAAEAHELSRADAAAKPRQPRPVRTAPAPRGFAGTGESKHRPPVREWGVAAWSSATAKLLSGAAHRILSRPPERALALRDPDAQRRGVPIRQDLEATLAHEQWRGRRLLLIAGLGFVGFGAAIPISGAVVVPGNLVVQSSVKKVQHPQGGVVAAIGVRNGSKVRAGEEVVRLDQTSARANLQVVARQLDEVRLRIARLKAERDGLDAPRWPSMHAAEISNSDRSEMLASERGLFAARASSRRSQQELARTRISQLETQVAALEAQLKSNGRQSAIAGGELKGVEELLRQKLVTLPRATALQREAAQLEGIKGQLSAQIAETRAKESETRLQALQAEETFRTEVMRDLREAEAREGELVERELAARDQMVRTSIRAPAAGTVHELALHTVGGVVAPAEVLMLVVPDGDTLALEARLGIDKIDQVRVGQTARVRFTALDQRTTPELEGRVDVVPADATRDPQSGAFYYSLRITLVADEPRRIGRVELHPGMPAEVFLETESRTMLSYLFKPFADQMLRMFRER